MLRASFEQVAQLYDRARPTYPAQIFDDLAALAELRSASHIVEIGCGTGQATLPLAQRGYQITCVELGEQLGAAAQRKLASFPNVEVVAGDFETWRPPRADFDAVVAFTAFHWITPEVRYVKPASLLRERGRLAVVSTYHVLPRDGDDFFIEVQKDYEAVLPEDLKTKAGPPVEPDAVNHVLGAEIEASGLFRSIGTRRYLWDVTYTADEYLALLDTYSGHRTLDDETRERLLSRIRQRIDARPGRQVRKTHLAILDVGARL